MKLIMWCDLPSRFLTLSGPFFFGTWVPLLKRSPAAGNLPVRDENADKTFQPFDPTGGRSEDKWGLVVG